MARNYYQIQNIYPHLKNKQKMIAENKTVCCRSSWEISFITKFLDVREDIIEWTSEDFFIPYKYDVDGKVHRYFPDFWVKSKSKDGNIQEYIVEIKPLVECSPPSTPAKKTKAYIERVHTYIKNQNKWTAAKLFCLNEQNTKNKKIQFMILTEKDLKGIL
jgi:hypothetical protein